MEQDTDFKSIKLWAEDDKPREKMMLKGAAALSDAELLAILIGTGTRNESAVDLAKRLMSMANHNLIELSKKTVKELQKVKGIGVAKAVSIAAALELGRRRRAQEPMERRRITSSRDTFEIVAPHLAELDHEQFWVILLNRANKVTGKSCLSVGGINGTVADTRLILRYALDNLATGIILCHNHPSGNLQPSDADINLTKNVKQAAGWMDINVLDHIIISESGYYSFADEGKL
ncbi:MAG: RadC family protein [Flavobacteriales bacterium]